MNARSPVDAPIIEHILHPSDFSPASEQAFCHALKLALVARCPLSVLHVSGEDKVAWTDFPRVRSTLERWSLLPPNSPRSAVPQLGIDVFKVVAKDRDTVRSVAGFLDQHPADLIVLATSQHAGRTAWLDRSVAEPVARSTATMTLFVPAASGGFVSSLDGAVRLDSILIPVAAAPRPQPAIGAAARLVRRLGLAAGRFVLLHVGEAGEVPPLHCPEVPGWQWEQLCVSGHVIDTIIGTAANRAARLIVMATDGRNGFLDALRGSNSERVLRRAGCPVLAIPDQAPVNRALQAER